MNKEYWDNFYKKKRISTPTPFAEFCVTWALSRKEQPGRRVYDLGCGNGRDTKYWAKSGFLAKGVDQSCKSSQGTGWTLSTDRITTFINTTPE